MRQNVTELLRHIERFLPSVQDNTYGAIALRFVLILLASGFLYLLLRAFYSTFRRHQLRRLSGLPFAQVFDSPLIPRLLQVVPLTIIGVCNNHFFLKDLDATKWIHAVLDKGVRVYFLFLCANVFATLLRIAYAYIPQRASAKPQKGLFQGLIVLGYCFAAIGCIAIFLERDPVHVLAGMGAASAVLMLIFKDSILGLTAGVTIAGNNIVQIGDWIEVPGADADGDVIDIALTTVRVQNWDKTITSIPAYDLVAKPFKNWRGMRESGGRRIKRAILIDLESVHFADEAELARWSSIDLLRDYLAQKREAISTYNAEHPSSTSSIANARHLTNIGTFRAYCLAYLNANSNVKHDMLCLVRQLTPTERGLPLEIYCFANTTAWTTYEAIQSDIFDHLLAIMPLFGLTAFQVASSTALHATLKKG